jgi:hypothetical protein
LHTRQQLQLRDTGDSLRPSEAGQPESSCIASSPSRPRALFANHAGHLNRLSHRLDQTPLVHLAAHDCKPYRGSRLQATSMFSHESMDGVATPLAGSKACGGGVGPRHRLKLPRRRLTKKAVSHPLDHARMKE